MALVGRRMSVWVFVVVWVFVLGMALLIAGVGLVWRKRFSIDVTLYQGIRAGAAIFGIGWGAVSMWRLSSQVVSQQSITRDFAPELIGYLAFWVLVPPTWFFLDYYALDNGAVAGIAQNKDAVLKSSKDYADFASRIWAAVVVLLVALVALMK